MVKHLNWSDAKQYCEKLHNAGSLVAIHSADEQKAVEKYLVSHQGQQRSHKLRVCDVITLVIIMCGFVRPCYSVNIIHAFHLTKQIYQCRPT